MISAGAFGAYPTFAPGSWIEIYGTNFAVGTQAWTTGDFDGGVNAPTKLGGVTVTVGGKPAYVDYISPTQVNAQVPSGVGTGSQSVIVTTPTGATPPFSVTVEAAKPGLLAPPSFKVGANQYVVALFPDGTYVVPPGAIQGISSRRARPGDTILLYGVGFGSVTPNIAPGVIAQQTNTLSLPLIVTFGGTDANVSYKGLAPNFVGLYQFNVVVPDISASDSVPLTFSLGGVSGPQTLSIAVGN